MVIASVYLINFCWHEFLGCRGTNHTIYELIITWMLIEYLSSEWGRRVTRGGRGGEVSPALFQKLEKSALILGKNALIVVIYGLNFLFKMQFVRFSRRKSWRFFPAGPFFSTRLFIKVPYFQENSAALKNSWLRACRDISLCLNVDSLNTWKFILQQKSWRYRTFSFSGISFF